MAGRSGHGDTLLGPATPPGDGKGSGIRASLAADGSAGHRRRTKFTGLAALPSAPASWATRLQAGKKLASLTADSLPARILTLNLGRSDAGEGADLRGGGPGRGAGRRRGRHRRGAAVIY